MNQIEPSRRTIDGLDFELSPLTAWKGMETFTRVTRFIAPAVSSIFSKGSGDTGAALALAFQGLASNSPAELKSITEILLEGCTVAFEGRTVRLLTVFDTVMRGKIFTVFKLLAWAVEVNYADFFAALKSGLGLLKPAALTEFQSMLQSTPSSSGPASDSLKPAG